MTTFGDTTNTSLREPSAGQGTARDAAELRGRMEKFFEDVDRYAADLKVKVVGEAFDRVVSDTPVDTGQARRSWQISVGSPNFAQQGDPKTTLKASKLTDRIFIVNPMPYITRLNNGWSKQAPSGYIEQAIAQVLLKYSTQGGTPR